MPISPPPSVHTPSLLFRADLSGTAFGGTPTWTPIDVLAEGQGMPVEITWGRGDEEADVTPRQMVLIVDNQNGDFTPKRVASPYYPYVRRGFRGSLQLTVNSTTYDRFDGYCAQIEQAWPGGDAGWSTVRLTFTDITARLAIGSPLRSMVIQEMLLDSPTYLYPLDEASGSVSAGSIAASPVVAARKVDGKNGAGTVTFGADTGLFDATSGVNFGTSSAYQGAVSVLSIASNNSAGPFVSASTPHSVECWFVAPSAIPANDVYLLRQSSGTSSGGSYAAVTMKIPSGSGALTYAAADVGGVYNALVGGATSICDGLRHHAVATLNADRRTCSLYIDGVLVDTDVSSSAMSFSGMRFNVIGGLLGTNETGYQFPGTISLVAMYPTELSAARILAHYQAGVGTLTELSGARYARLASYGNVTTSGLPTGQATIGAQKTEGKTLTEALAQVARTEGTPSFATGAGALTFQARNLRYNATATVTLDANDVESLAPRDDGQGFFNDITVTRDGGASQRVIDAASQTQYGRSAGPTLDVCPSTDEDALQHAYWEVGIHKDPDNRLPDLTVDLLTQPDVAKIQGVLACTVSSLITVSGLPANAPSTSISQFVEGAREVIGLTQWDMAFYTSPNLPPVWVVEDPVFGVIDSTNRVAF